MKISVIIVNYNVRYFLEQALLSVRKALMLTEGEVWVVDNNSVDGSVQMVREKFPEVNLIANEQNLGFSGANNQAIRRAKGEFILLLNPDTVVEEETFIKVCRFMDEHPDAGGLGVKMIDGKGNFLPESKRGLPTPQVAFFKMSGLSGLFPKSRLFGRYHLGYLDKDKTHEVEVLAGAFMLLRKSVLDKIGLLDETFFMYGEDIDLSYRITRAGYKNYYFPETTIIHYKGESTKKTSVNYVFVFYKAMVIFARKHYSEGLARSFGVFINLAIWFRAFAALTHRFLLKAWQPLLDTLVLFGVSYFLKIYWEQNHKFVLGGEYPPTYLYINVVVYLICWISGLYFAGTYRRHSPLRRIFFGMLSGTIAIAVLYAFAPDHLRFSRALIILGAIFGTTGLAAYRLLAHFIRHKSLNYGERLAYNTIIVGDEPEASRVKKLLEESQMPHTLLGFVSASDKKPEDPSYLGTIQQLDEIIRVFKVTEVIFCGQDLSSTNIISRMGEMSEEVNFKIVPENSLYIIGSNSKNTNGELYTIDISLALALAPNRDKKRLFDLILAFSFLPLLPFLLFLVKNKGGFLRNIFRVMAGKRSWVGYFRHPSVETLPQIPDGVLSPTGMHIAAPLSIDAGIINFRYARDYRLGNDMEILLSNMQGLGNER